MDARSTSAAPPLFRGYVWLMRSFKSLFCIEHCNPTFRLIRLVPASYLNLCHDESDF